MLGGEATHNEWAAMMASAGVVKVEPAENLHDEDPEESQGLDMDDASISSSLGSLSWINDSSSQTVKSEEEALDDRAALSRVKGEMGDGWAPVDFGDAIFGANEDDFIAALQSSQESSISKGDRVRFSSLFKVTVNEPPPPPTDDCARAAAAAAAAVGGPVTRSKTKIKVVPSAAVSHVVSRKATVVKYKRRGDEELMHGILPPGMSARAYQCFLHRQMRIEERQRRRSAALKTKKKKRESAYPDRQMAAALRQRQQGRFVSNPKIQWVPVKN